MSGGVGFYGKLPGAGDFVRRRLPSDFIDAWDRHFQRAVETGRRELGEHWSAAWRHGAAWRFVLPPQVCGNGAWCGLTGPAADRLGRAFPMVLAAPCGGDVARILGNGAWFDALERVYRSAQHEAVSVETFDARVAALPRPLAHAGELATLWRGLPWDSGQWQLEMPGGAAAGAILSEAWRQMGLRAGPWCLWWTEGAARLLATRGLPRSHAVLLDATQVPRGGEAGLLDGLREDSSGQAGVGLPLAVPPSHAATETILSDWLADRAPGDLPASQDWRELATGSGHRAMPSVGDAARIAAARAVPTDNAPMSDAHGASFDGAHATHSTRSAQQPTPSADAILWLDAGRTLVLSADDGPYDARHMAARGIRDTLATSASDRLSQRNALMSLHARLRDVQHTALSAPRTALAGQHATAAPANENGAALVVRFDGTLARLLRVGAAAVWQWRRGQLQAAFVERPAGAGGEFDDLLFGDAWPDMPGIGAPGEADFDEAALQLEPGDRLLLLVTRALTQLPRASLAEALALPTCDGARTHLALRAGLATRPAQWPLAVLEVDA